MLSTITTLSVQRAINQKPNVIQKGILYLSNDRSSYDDVTEQLFQNLNSIDSSASYAKRLEMWHSFQLSLSAVCVCDTSNLFETSDQFEQIRYGDSVLIKPGHEAPIYEKIYRIEPEPPFDVVQLNISNIINSIDCIGPFKDYKRELIFFIENNSSSKFLEGWINNEIQNMEKSCAISHGNVFAKYEAGVSYWYNAFISDRESLNVNDYKIWMPQIHEINMYRENTYINDWNHVTSLPKMCYWFTDKDILTNAAKAFLYTKKIPFLKEFREKLIKELYPDPPSVPDIILEQNESIITTKNQKESGAKLTWQGDKKVLVNILRQMKTNHNKKGQSLLKESYEDIAIFLIQHISGFENAKISTLRGLLTKELNDPKGNFISLDLTESD